MENKGSHLSRSKALLISQHEELKKQFDEEVKVCVRLTSQTCVAVMFVSD